MKQDDPILPSFVTRFHNELLQQSLHLFLLLLTSHEMRLKKRMRMREAVSWMKKMRMKEMKKDEEVEYYSSE